MFTKKTIEKWRDVMMDGGKSLAEMKIQRGIIQGDVLSPLRWAILMMRLRKCTEGYKLQNRKKKKQLPNVD